MAGERFSCPKCGHSQSGGKECASCGVIFARYKRVLQRKKELAEQAAKEAEAAKKKSSTLVMVVMALALVAVTAGGTYYFVTPGKSKQQRDSLIVADVPSGNVEKARPQVQEARDRKPVESSPEPEVFQSSSIEYARQATVSIETPWGTGSGFFVSSNFIVTNRHVVELNQDELEKFRHKVETSRKMIDLEEKKIRKYRQEMKRLPKGPQREQVRIYITEMQKNIDRIMPEQERAEERLQEMERQTGAGDLKVILADGSEHYANFLLMSENYDLALLAISVTEHPVLKRPPGNYRINQGDKVFTIGSPVGLRNTVTSGVFSGMRKSAIDGQILLQTDAPINPGNSGGPLIDEKGYVRGVNTMIFRDTEGIGFAIPIEKVFEDFGASIY
ncbi:trypsin-like peptidase domain-containing protein [Desulfopila sp. IMCC35008]|uniref:trypsin-like peptidase domain-containing protein n=1 Tax=Desulfopila sp. IMCC35008 TaxID=2653858 RepID=UPI0013D275A4|nr:trypsin-like peptidase domain-containing protein [Desulfopila sp. IMCC35008]